MSSDVKYIKLNWYEEELHKFYTTDKDNNGYIHGIALYEKDDIYLEEMIDIQWYKTEQERDKELKEVSYY